MPITSAVGHADAQAILDELGQPLLDELGQVIYDFDGFGGFGWASAAGVRVAATVGAATGSGAAFGVTIASTVPADPVTVSTFTGTKFYIGGTDEFSVSPDDAPWIEVTNISHLGEYGEINFSKVAMTNVVGDDYARQIKGLAFSPVLDLILNRDDADPGQYAMRVANADEQGDYYNFKIEESESGTIFARTIFRGQVFNFETVSGGVNAVKGINTSIEVNPDTIINSVL